MAQSKQPVLSLSTLAPDRPVIEIDDTRYEIAIAGDLGLVASAKLAALQPSMLAFSKIKGTPSDEAFGRMSNDLKEFVGLIVLECDAAVLDKLNDKQRMDVVNVFISAAAINVKPVKTKARTKRTTTRKT